MQNQAFLVTLFRQFPQFLQADAKFLVIARQSEFLDQDF